jgi:hypothetical protein
LFIVGFLPGLLMVAAVSAWGVVQGVRYVYAILPAGVLH